MTLLCADIGNSHTVIGLLDDGVVLDHWRVATDERRTADEWAVLLQGLLTGEFKEVIMATNPTLEGDGTALFISQQLAEYPVELTRLARGITTGSVLEFANKEILTDALSGRQKF